MNTLFEIFVTHSVGHAVLLVSLVIAIGLSLSRIRLLGVQPGIAMVLFVGIVAAHFGASVELELLEFVRDFGLILFVYSIGLQVGPGFFSAFRRAGLPLNILALSIVLLGAGLVAGMVLLGWIDPLAALGLYAGSVTNTPSLAAIQQSLHAWGGFSVEQAAIPNLAYATAYPFGIFGTIFAMNFARWIFRVDVVDEVRILEKQHEKPKLSTLTILIENTNLDGLKLRDVPGLSSLGIAVTRIMQKGDVRIANPDLQIHLGDTLLAVGLAPALKELCLIMGRESEIDLQKASRHITTSWVVVTRDAALGQTLEELELAGQSDVAVSRVVRSGIEFAAIPSFRVQWGDRLLVVGEAEDMAQVGLRVGNSLKSLQEPNVAPVFAGIAIGVVLGSIPLALPGLASPIKLGIAGGPLVVSILLSRIGRLGPLNWYLPASASAMLRDFGIALFLAAVGLKSGGSFFDVLRHGEGVHWFVLGLAVTGIPLLFTILVGRLALKLNYVTLCGVLAGAMTSPPALSYARTACASESPLVSYATVYPLTMLARIVSVQVLAIFLLR